jgi:hypothetical protein
VTENPVEIIPAAWEAVQRLRSGYLDSLAEPQGFHCERLSREARCWLFRKQAENVGYALIGREGLLVEFHVERTEPAVEAAVLDGFVEAHGIGRALCKTFDCGFLALCRPRAIRHRIKGHVFRSIVDTSFTERPDFMFGRGPPATLRR